mgnify:CR=1 FL=1
MQTLRGYLQKLGRAFIREFLIKLIIIVPLFAIMVASIKFRIVIGAYVRLSIVQYLTSINVTGELVDSYSLTMSNLFLFLTTAFLGISSLFIGTFRNSWKFLRRLYRAFNIAVFLLILAVSLLFSALFTIGLIDPDANILPFLSDLLAGLGTEITGALLLFVLLEVFAKTWEENEEAEYTDSTQDSSAETDEKLKVILEQWQQQQLEFSQQAKATANQSLWGRIFSPQKMPSAYYEGQASALSNAIQELQQIATQPDDAI